MLKWKYLSVYLTPPILWFVWIIFRNHVRYSYTRHCCESTDLIPSCITWTAAYVTFRSLGHVFESGHHTCKFQQIIMQLQWNLGKADRGKAVLIIKVVTLSGRAKEVFEIGLSVKICSWYCSGNSLDVVFMWGVTVYIFGLEYMAGFGLSNTMTVGNMRHILISLCRCNTNTSWKTRMFFSWRIQFSH